MICTFKSYDRVQLCRRGNPSLDNARVNRADEKCKLVKTESDTMGARDHPTTSHPQRLGRFGSTHCYPCSRCFRCFNSIDSIRRSRACLCMGRACRPHVRVNLANELAVQLSRFRHSLLRKSAKTTRWTSMLVAMAAFRHAIGCIPLHFTNMPTRDSSAG